MLQGHLPHGAAGPVLLRVHVPRAQGAQGAVAPAAGDGGGGRRAAGGAAELAQGERAAAAGGLPGAAADHRLHQRGGNHAALSSTQKAESQT